MTPAPPDVSGAARVLFVDHTAALGGAELCLLDIASGFGAGSAVALFEHGPLSEALGNRGVTVVPIHSGRALNNVKKQSQLPGPTALAAAVRATFALARVSRSYDLLYANTPKSFLIGAAAGLLARRPVIWHLHDILSVEHFSASNIRLMIGATNRGAHRVVANSHASARAFVTAGGRPDMVRVVYNGIDPTPFDELSPGSRDEARRELGIADDAFVVGSFSRLHPWKGQRVLLDALERLPGVHALIVGGALFSGEEAYEAELRERSATPVLAGRVHLLGMRHDVARLMHACDAVAHTSVLPEPFGRVLVESLLARRPLVATEGGGVGEIVQHGTTALLVPPGDVTRLASAITLLRDDPTRAQSLALAGSNHVRTHFTRGAMIDGVRLVVDDVLGAAAHG